ncbi:MAG: PLDc N-terminal domain-containing protein [Desulfuromonadales bacterium]|nr:PLDc N-terminal domain-containing protein [Desulfuromonadales bacterium]
MAFWAVVGLLGMTGLLSAGHALLRKRDPRAALGWIMLCLGVPGVGAGLYWLLGVNRIQTRARVWMRRGVKQFWQDSGITPPATPVVSLLGGDLQPLQRLADHLTRRPLLPGNRLQILHNGEEAYPAMLAAIAGARQSVFLSTYIFDSDQTGRRFADALRQAAARGVDVRVLVDALGERYSFPPARRLFKGSGIRTARFLPPLAGGGLHLNLRNHRKLLIVDRQLGFTGGMNIGDRHLTAGSPPGCVVDIQFQVEGPVVAQMEQAFLEDWHFATRQALRPAPPRAWAPAGGAFCRGISDGPNEEYDQLSWLLIGILNCARHRVRIMTPYFIPDRPLISAINAASLRGVAVEIILPEKNNLPYLAWASMSYLWEFLVYGTRIFFQPPPFVHSKVLLMDEEYALVGSANLDPRSLRLNFEFNLEVYDRVTAETLGRHFEAVRSRSRETSLAEMDARPLPVKLRDAFAKLFSPYL